MPNALTKQAAARAAVRASNAPAIGNIKRVRLVRRAESGEQCLICKPLADESVQRRQPGNGDRTDQEDKAVPGMRRIRPPILSMLRVSVACTTPPAPRNSRHLKMA